MFRTSLMAVPVVPLTMATFDCTLDRLCFSNSTNASITVSVLDGLGHPIVPGSEVPAIGRVDFITKNNPSIAAGGFSILANTNGLYFSAEWSPQ